MWGREELFELDGERAGPFQIGDACTVGAILRWPHDSCAARHHRGEVGVAIRAVEADGGDAVVGRGVENQRKRTELEDGHARVAEARHYPAFRREPLGREEQFLHLAVYMRDRHKHPFWNSGFKLNLASS